MDDVAIIGAGPAGLSAALILGRCRRRVRVFDHDRARNAVSRGLHGFLTRDGIHPRELRDLGRRELARYGTVRLEDTEVLDVRRIPGGFHLADAAGRSWEVRFLLLATGRDDALPEHPGFREFYGRGVYHCPICDGWEHRDQALAAYGAAAAAGELALELLTWSRDVTWYTNGPAPLDRDGMERVRRQGVVCCERPISALLGGPDQHLAGIRFHDGAVQPCQALFFDAACPQKSPFPAQLGCEMAPSGGIRCDEHAATNVPGVFVAGNVRCGVHLAITAAAEGAEAGIAINDALLEADLSAPLTRPKI